MRDDAGKMAGSPFDDRTISLSIANQMIKYVWLEAVRAGTPTGSWHDGLVERQLYGDDVFAKITPHKRPTRARTDRIDTWSATQGGS